MDEQTLKQLLAMITQGDTGGKQLPPSPPSIRPAPVGDVGHDPSVRPRSPLSKATSISANPFAEGMNDVVDMVTGMGGGGMAGMVKKVGPKAAPMLKSAKERFEAGLGAASQSEADEFLKNFLPSQRGKGVYPKGITSPDPYEVLASLWEAFKKGGM